MIVIAGNDSPIDTSPLNSMEKSIYLQKYQSPVIYSYDSFGQLKFELAFRTKIIEAAKALQAAKVDFAAFKKSRCNWKYWTRTPEGGFQLRPNAVPSAAIRDIFVSGGLYAFECATAMVIVLYKAMLDMVGAEIFNSLFADLLLWDWNYDSDLHLITVDHVDEAYPGDILYFANPDYSPATPEWQGENVVMLASDFYYGHGIGNRNAKQMIEDLNKHRRPNSKQSAYLKQQATYPDYKYLYQSTVLGHVNPDEPLPSRIQNASVFAEIGSSRYIRL